MNKTNSLFRRDFLRIAGAAVAGGAVLAAPAMARADVVYSTSQYEHNGVVLMTDKVFLKGKKLYLRLRVINKTGKLLTVDKRQLQLKLSTGALLMREEGVFGKFAKPNNIDPGLSHDLNIEFMAGEIPLPAALILKEGFIVEGKALPLPEFAITPAGTK